MLALTLSPANTHHGGLNRQYAAHLLGLFFPSFRYSIRSTSLSYSFFTLKTMLFLLLRPLLISFHSFPCRAQSYDLAAIHLHGYSGSAYPRHYFYAIAWTNAHGFGLIFPLTAPKATAADLQKPVHDWSPHPILKRQIGQGYPQEERFPQHLGSKTG